MRVFFLWIGLTLALATPGLAQDSDTAADTAAAAVQPWPTVDVGDVWHRFRPKADDADDPDSAARSAAQRHFVVVAPAIGSKPSTGLTLGLNGNMAFFQGDPRSTHISTLAGGFRVSQKHQVLSNVRFNVFTSDDRWFLQGDNRLNWTSLNTYALGSDSGTTDAANLKYSFARLYETAYRAVKPGLFVGGGLNIDARWNIRPGDAVAHVDQSAYVAYTEKNGFALDQQASTGANVGLLYDTRDNAINATRGWLASGAYRTFFKGLGGDATWQELTADVRTYRSLNSSGSQRIAVWLMSDLVTGGVAPFFDLPTTGGDVRSGRGYSEGRFRGEHLMYGEVEYRGTLTPNGLVGFVVFANSSTIGSAETGARLFESYAPAAGTGLRVLLNKRSRTNLTTDWGWGKDGARGFYLGIQEAF
jgi:outer membrane protein assembly factor BamA